MSTPGHLKCYGSLSELIADYRALTNEKPGKLARDFAKDRRTLYRWATGAPPSTASLRDFARTTLLPFELLLRLSHELPTYANLRTRRMAVSDWDLELVRREVVQERLLQQERPQSIEVETVQVDRDVELIEKSRALVYRRDRRPSRDIFAKAVEYAPSLNLIARGPALDGTAKDEKKILEYSGHVITLPLNREAHAALRRMDPKEGERLHEHDLTPEHLLKFEGSEFPLGALHIQSFFAFNSQVAYVLLHALLTVIVSQRASLVKQGCSLSQYVVTSDGDQLGRALGLTQRFEDHPETNREKTEIAPRYRDAPIGSLDWLHQYSV